MSFLIVFLQTRNLFLDHVQFISLTKFKVKINFNLFQITKEICQLSGIIVEIQLKSDREQKKKIINIYHIHRLSHSKS